MKARIPLLSLCVFGLSLGLSVPAKALDVPEGKAAIAEAVIGKVRFDEGQGFKPLHVGDALAPGASIETGGNGRATLTLAEDATMRIAPNTEMTLKNETVRKGTFLQLTRGLARFLVGKRAPGYAFEVQTQNAVAAVKGTDWDDDAGDGKGPTKTSVYASKNKVALLLTGEGGKTTELAPGEKVAFDGKEFKVTELSDADRKKADDLFKALPPVKHDESEPTVGTTPGAGGGTPEPTLATTPAMSDEEKAALKTEMKEITDKAIAEASHDLYVDGFTLKDTRTGDLQAGKIIYDRFGDRVQVTHYIFKNDQQQDQVSFLQTWSTVTIASYSLRDSGPNKGLSSAIETSTFNTVLPENWGKIFTTPFDDPSNLDDGSGHSQPYPIYYRKSESFIATNPTNDVVNIATTYDAPVFIYNSDLPGPMALFMGRDVTMNVVGGLPLSQQVIPSACDCLIAGPPALSFSYGYHAQNLTGDTANSGVTVTNGQWLSTATALGTGGWTFDLHTSTPTDIPVLSQDMHFINNAGTVLPLDSFEGPQLPSAFKGYKNNIEMALRSPVFDGRSIDVVFLPGFFDYYDMLQLPTDSQGCLCP